MWGLHLKNIQVNNFKYNRLSCLFTFSLVEGGGGGGWGQELFSCECVRFDFFLFKDWRGKPLKDKNEATLYCWLRKRSKVISENEESQI